MTMKYILLLLAIPGILFGQSTTQLIDKTTGAWLSPISATVKKGNSISTSAVDANFVFEGDSLTLGNNNTPGQEYPTLFALLPPIAQFGRTMSNVSATGNDLADIVSQYAAQVFPLRPAVSGRTTYLVVWIGANDLAGGDIAAAGGPAAWWAILEGYLQTAKTDGFTVVVATILPINNQDGYDADRSSVNKLMTESSVPDYVFRVDQLFPNPSITTWYNVDGIHLTNLANAAVAENLLSIITCQKRGFNQYDLWLGKGRLGISNPNPKGSLDTFGAWSIIGGDSLTDNATKTSRVGSRHYDIDEEPVVQFTSNSSVSANQLTIGGGTASGNSATQLLFYAAANTTTTTGTVIGEAGLTYWVLGNQNEGSNAIVTINGTRPMIRASADSANAQANTGFMGVNNIGASSYTTNSALNDLILTAPAGGRVLFGTSTAGTQIARGWFTAAGDFNTEGALSITGETTIGAGGITANGAGLKHGRITTGSIAAGATALVTLTWGTAFADANYTVSAEVEDATTTSLSLSVVHVESKTSSAVTVRVINNSVGALTGTLNIIAIHD